MLEMSSNDSVVSGVSSDGDSACCLSEVQRRQLVKDGKAELRRYVLANPMQLEKAPFRWRLLH